jgi:hypothetical protein
MIALAVYEGSVPKHNKITVNLPEVDIMTNNILQEYREYLIALITEGEEKYINELWENYQGLFCFHACDIFQAKPHYWEMRGYRMEDMKSESYFVFRQHLKRYIRHKELSPASAYTFNVGIRNTSKTHFNIKIAGMRSKKQAERVPEERQVNKSQWSYIRGQDPLNSAFRFEACTNDSEDDGTLGEYLIGLVADKQNVQKLVEQRHIQQAVKRVYETLDEDCKQYIITTYYDGEAPTQANGRPTMRKALGLTEKQATDILDRITKAFLADSEIKKLFLEFIKRKSGITYRQLKDFTWGELKKFTYGELAGLRYEQIHKLNQARTKQMQMIVFYREICGLDWRVVSAAVGYDKSYRSLQVNYSNHFANDEKKAAKEAYRIKTQTRRNELQRERRRKESAEKQKQKV